MRGSPYDILVVGGGINGAGIAADAAGRGLNVVLVEMGDLGGATSSASSKLIHGGLRYLEHWEFRLVREALAERDVLLERAPHIVWPLRFVLPHTPDMRSRAMIRAGLFLYDHLARRKHMAGSRALNLRREAIGRSLRSDLIRGWSYWDCWVDDARLVVLNARLAANFGAAIFTRTKVEHVARGGECWSIAARGSTGERIDLSARVVIDACGPWAGRLTRANEPHATPRLRLVKGSHIVVPKIADCNDALILQNDDRRVVFVLPFEERFSLIGTTDVPYDGEPGSAVCSDEEEAYLLRATNRFLAHPLNPSDVVWRFSGVRPLWDEGGASNPSAISRDYRIVREGEGAGRALLTVLGGKVTTYRKLAEAVVEMLRIEFPALAPRWTADQPLPGGDIQNMDFGRFLAVCTQRYAFLPTTTVSVLARRYGTCIHELLAGTKSIADLGGDLGHGLTAREVVYLRDREWAVTADDILWRRTKLGLAIGDRAMCQAVGERIEAVLSGQAPRGSGCDVSCK